jgi:hypothetical protein
MTGRSAELGAVYLGPELQFSPSLTAGSPDTQSTPAEQRGTSVARRVPISVCSGASMRCVFLCAPAYLRGYRIR